MRFLNELKIPKLNWKFLAHCKPSVGGGYSLCLLSFGTSLCRKVGKLSLLENEYLRRHLSSNIFIFNLVTNE